MALPALTVLGGVTVKIKIDRRRRSQSPMLDRVDEEIEAERKWWKFTKSVERGMSRPGRWAALIMVVVFVLFAAYLAFPFLSRMVADPETVEIVKRCLGLFDCVC